MSEEEYNNMTGDENENQNGGSSSEIAGATDQNTEPTEPTDTEGGEGTQTEEGASSESSSTSESDKLPHYEQSPNMICAKLRMNGLDADSVEKLKAMNIDRRWECDNRIPTWTFGLVNMGHDFHFVQNGGIICDTDDRLLKIEKDVDTEDGAIRKIVATRNIRYNGQGLQIDTSHNTEEEGESSSSN